MHFHIVTIFPDSTTSYLDVSVIGRAKRNGDITISFYDPREYVSDVHRTIDDRPYGGGAGMIMKAVPIISAVESILKNISDQEKAKIVLFSAKGTQYTQEQAQSWSERYDHIILVAGRYEGIDERVRLILQATEVSIGPYVLTDGDLPAMILISSIARLIPGVITFDSLEEESAWEELDRGLEYPHFTRPEVITHNGREFRVPLVLLSGNHEDIKEWREDQMK